MVRVILAALVVASSGCTAVRESPAPEVAQPAGHTITVPAARVAECRAQGGCVLVTRQELIRTVEEALELGSQLADCRRRGST